MHCNTCWLARLMRRNRYDNHTRCKREVSEWIYIALYIIYKLFISNKALRYSPCVTRGSHSFTCHPYEPYLPLLPSRKASPPFGWYSLRLPTKGWPGWVNLDGWSHTQINDPHRKLCLFVISSHRNSVVASCSLHYNPFCPKIWFIHSNGKNWNTKYDTCNISQQRKARDLQ